MGDDLRPQSSRIDAEVGAVPAEQAQTAAWADAVVAQASGRSKKEEHVWKACKGQHQNGINRNLSLVNEIHEKILDL